MYVCHRVNRDGASNCVFQRVAYSIPFSQILDVLSNFFGFVFKKLNWLRDFTYHISPYAIHLTVSLHGVAKFLVVVFIFKLWDRWNARTGAKTILAVSTHFQTMYHLMLTMSIGSTYGVAVWSVIELNVAVISACLPTMRPLLKGFEHTIISLRSSAINWSWAGDLFKSKNSSQASFERSRQGKGKFQQLDDNSLGVISAAKPANTRDLESVIGTSNHATLPWS